MIDIKTLKQYPLSFKLLEEWVEQNHTTALALLLDKVTNEELVEFLDENDLFLTIGATEGFDQTISFMFYILRYSTYQETFKTRKDATEYAILKAFKLLEQKLKLN